MKWKKVDCSCWARNISIVKSRGMEHSRDVWEFILSTAGIDLVPTKKDSNAGPTVSKNGASGKQNKKPNGKMPLKI
jgi:hypothetical protein